MAYKRQTDGPRLEEAKRRLTAMQTIDKAKKKVINYGEDDAPLSSVEVAAEVTAQSDRISAYNGLLDQCDALLNDLRAGEKRLGTMNTRVLAGAKSKFGPDATEVEQVGGTRQSERAKPVRKPKPAAPGA